MNNSCLPECIFSEANCRCLLTHKSAFFFFFCYKQRKILSPKVTFCLHFKVGPLIWFSTCLLSSGTGRSTGSITSPKCVAPFLPIFAIHSCQGCLGHHDFSNQNSPLGSEGRQPPNHQIPASRQLGAHPSAQANCPEWN